MRRVIVCGPPHSGKSVFLSNLQRLLPVEHHMLIFGAPDGEWHWSNEAAQPLVRETRQKKGFSDNFADNIVKAIESAEQRLVLVDTGGKRLHPNHEIFSTCDAFVIISSSREEMMEWRRFGEAQGCRCIAELDSVLHGTCEVYPAAGDGILRGRISGLERGQKVESPVLDAVAARLREIIKENSAMTEAELRADVNGVELVGRLWITDRSDPYLGVRPWHTAMAVEFADAVRGREVVRIWNIRASFLSCALSAALPGAVELFGVSEGYVRLPEIAPTGSGAGELEWETAELADFTLVKYRKQGFFTRESLAAVVPPAVNLRKGVVLSTDGPPIWLDATIARSYARAGAPWVGMFVPVESGRTQPSLAGRRWEEAHPSNGPVVVVSAKERERLGEIIPVPITFLKWNGGGWSWLLGSGEVVVDRAESHAATHPGVLPLICEALSRIRSAGRANIVEEVDLGRVVGENVCVETREGDDIVYAQRHGRCGLTRFVKNRKPEPCSVVSVFLSRAAEGSRYVLETAFIGPLAPAEPWDTEWATEKSVPFWDSHALVWRKEEVVSGTETDRCPW